MHRHRKNRFVELKMAWMWCRAMDYLMEPFLELYQYPGVLHPSEVYQPVDPRLPGDGHGAMHQELPAHGPSDVPCGEPQKVERA